MTIYLLSIARSNSPNPDANSIQGLMQGLLPTTQYVARLLPCYYLLHVSIFRPDSHVKIEMEEIGIEEIGIDVCEYLMSL